MSGTSNALGTVLTACPRRQKGNQTELHVQVTMDIDSIRINSAICWQLTKALGVEASCHFIENTVELLAILFESIRIRIARSPA